MTVAELEAGQYAIVDNGMAVLALSKRSFLPKDEAYANVVHLANGIGAFSKNTPCTIVSMETAFGVARSFHD